MFYSLPNLASSTVKLVEKPWDLDTGADAPYEAGKTDMIKWAFQPTTQHSFISAYEGVTPEVRVSKSNNPAFKMHALIGDYDLHLPANYMDYLGEKAPNDFTPNYLAKTCQGHARLIWLFENPILCSSEKHMKQFLCQIQKHMKLSKWLGGLDTEALVDPNLYYELGKDWEPIKPDKVIPSAHLELWFVKAADGLHLDEKKELQYKIPYDELEKEVHKRFTGAWQGPFIEGARGVRFWDSSADNETAAVVTADGMLCFTGGQAFVPWRQIFGTAFVEKFETDYVAGIVSKCAYDDKRYWVENDQHVWMLWNKDDFAQELRVRGYNPSRRGGQTCSEIDKIENLIKNQYKIEHAAPYLFFKPGRFYYKGKPVLNISTVRPLEPAAPMVKGKMSLMDGRKHFPFLYKFLRTLFVEDESEESEQLTAFLAWLKQFYVNSLEFTPGPGQAIVLAGVPGKGKTFLSRAVIGGLVGGYSDASLHLVDGDQWTERLAEHPVMAIDDSLATSDNQGMKRFTNRIKKYTANAEIVFNQKYKEQIELPWFGRIVITCNMDSESLRILPDPDLSNREKVCFFRTSDAKVEFKSWEENTKMLKRELPNFARFLVDWEVPSHWVSEESRYGVKAFHHPELLDEARQQGTGTVVELLVDFMDSYCQNHEERKEWHGTASQLYDDLFAFRPETVRQIRQRSLSTILGQLTKNGYRLSKSRNEKRLYIWTIHRDLTLVDLESPEPSVPDAE